MNHQMMRIETVKKLLMEIAVTFDENAQHMNDVALITVGKTIVDALETVDMIEQFGG